MLEFRIDVTPTENSVEFTTSCGGILHKYSIDIPLEQLLPPYRSAAKVFTDDFYILQLITKSSFMLEMKRRHITLPEKSIVKIYYTGLESALKKRVPEALSKFDSLHYTSAILDLQEFDVFFVFVSREEGGSSDRYIYSLLKEGTLLRAQIFNGRHVLESLYNCLEGQFFPFLTGTSDKLFFIELLFDMSLEETLNKNEMQYKKIEYDYQDYCYITALSNVGEERQHEIGEK